jgi:hypothetical protein
MYTLRRAARVSGAALFYAPEEVADVVLSDGFEVIRCAQETTARAARRRGFVDFEEQVEQVEGPAAKPRRRRSASTSTSTPEPAPADVPTSEPAPAEPSSSDIV